MNLKLSPEIAAGFMEEAQGYFAQMRDSFADWAAGNANALDEPRRLVHTIKGAASMIGLPALAHVSLLLEDTLKLLLGHAPMGAQAQHFQAALQVLDSYVQGLVAGDRRNADLAGAIAAIRRVRGDAEDGDSAAVKQILGHESVSTAVQTGNPEDEQDLRANFRYEAEDQLLAIGRSLRLLESSRDQDNKEILRALRRSIHSLKGSSQSIGLKALTELTHRLEDLLDGITSDQIAFSRGIERLLFSTFDTITDLATGDLEESTVWDRVNALRDMFAAVISASRQGDSALEITEEAEDDNAGEGEDGAEAEEIPAEFIDVFRQEADEHFNVIATRLREVQGAPSAEARREAIQDVRRATHTLKGAAGVIGFRTLSSLAHRMEDLLDAAWEGSVTLDAPQLQLLHETSDVLSDLVTDPTKREDALARRRQLLPRYAQTMGRLAKADGPAWLSPPRAEEPVAPASPVIEIPPGEDPQPKPVRSTRLDAASDRTAQYVRVPIERLDEMVRLVSELVVSRSTFEQHLDAYRRDVDELRFSLGRLRRLSQKFDTDFEVQALLGGPGAAVTRRIGHDRQEVDRRSEFDTLEFDRYTDLHLVARDLSETVTDISVGVSLLSHRSGDFDGYLTRIGRLTSDIQDRFMRMRMVPLANLATRLHRVVRVTADRVGKQVDLVLEGEHVEMDKTALEELAGPLEHLLRNAVDHGIENEHLRRSAGKRPRGQVVIRAYYLGTHVVVEVTDDGRGMDAAAIRARAVAQGLYTEPEANALSDSEAFELAFRPGFSTAREVTDISGRGVGLDVVKGAVTRMKGAIQIESRPNEGTSFHLRLPMSLAILRVLMVKSRGEIYAVPLGAVTRILRLEPGQLEQVGTQQILRLDQQALPAIRLDEALGGKTGETATDQERPPVLIVDLGGSHAALVVDELLLAREVVVKTLGSLIRKVKGVTGATIRGDGAIVLIVNPSELFENGRATSSNSPGRTWSRPQRQTGFDILVVDDSVSVRRVLTNLLQNHGWRSTAAKDGMEALEILQSGKEFDAVLLDMEMPRMDGYELLTLLRGQPQFAGLPVVMLTSRAAEKHRRKAFDLGANDYLVKPYQDEALLGVLTRVVRERREAGVKA